MVKRYKLKMMTIHKSKDKEVFIEKYQIEQMVEMMNQDERVSSFVCYLGDD